MSAARHRRRPHRRWRQARHVAVAVIGAGFTGLSTALHLAEAGIDVAVLEAKEIGWGASGRAFGQVVPYLKPGHEAILRHYGPERGQRIVDAVAAGPDLVFELIGRHGIECWAMRSGLIFAAHSPGGRRDLERRTQYWQQRNAPVEMLEGMRCAEAIGSSYYRAASLDRRGGNINPFAYARGLAHAAAKAGAVLHARTRVRGLARRDGRWAIDTGNAGMTADNVVIATNAYTGDLWPGLRESIIPMRGHGFVTEPLSDNVRHTILPERQSLTDTRLLYSGVRMLPDGRLHGSAHGPSFGAEPAGRLAPRRCTHPAAVPAAWRGAVAAGVERLGGDDHRPFPAPARIGTRTVRRSRLQRPRHRGGHDDGTRSRHSGARRARRCDGVSVDAAASAWLASHRADTDPRPGAGLSRARHGR